MYRKYKRTTNCKTPTDMKIILGLIATLFLGLADINAMSYEEARDRARFLTDKMAYELNLNDQQYNDAYEINLDYLMNIRTADDVSGIYLEHRNADLQFILYSWQFSLFQAANYFFRPVIWRTTGWYLPIYGIYTPGRFYYKPPTIYNIYRGGHYAYRHEHRISFYINRRPVWNGGFRGESRGPISGRPILSPHKPAPSHKHNQPGFRFEPVGKPSRPATRPRPTETHREPHKDNSGIQNGRRPTIETPVTRSNYKRRSSTRTTVNTAPTRPQLQTRPKAPNTSRGTARPATSSTGRESRR